MGVATLGAILVFVLIFNYVQNVSSQVGPLTTVYRFSRPVARLSVIQASDLEQVKIPSRWVPPAAIQSFDTTRGLVALEPVTQGALLQQGMAGPPPELQPGQREIAIMINAETGVAGKVKPGDLVDIYATFAGEGAAKTSQARVIVANALVLAIGQLQRVDAPSTDGNRFAQAQAVPVTFALTVTDSLKVTYAESYATKLRLALIAPGTRSAADPARDLLTGPQAVAPAPSPPGKPAATPKAPVPSPRATTPSRKGARKAVQ